MEASQPALKPGDRVTLEVTGTVAYFGEISLNLKVHGVYGDVRLDNHAYRVARNRGPELTSGDRAYSAELEEEVEIVMLDAASDAYVVRRPNGELFVHPDNSDLTASVAASESEAA